MSSDELKRLLTSVGRAVFVEYYERFADSSLSNQDVADMLPASYTLKSRLSRTSHARSIMSRGLTVDALTLIAESTRLDNATVQEANERLVRV